MTDFRRLDSADSFLGSLTRWVHGAVQRTGPEAWNYDPAMRETRERALRLMVRAVKKRDRLAAGLVRAGVPDGIPQARLRQRAKDRDRADCAVRDPRPLGRASR